jgi:hypothetical protein
VSEGPFTRRWVEEHLILKEDKAVPPDDGGYDQIVAGLNRAFACEMLKNERPSSHPSMLSPAQALQALGFRLGVPGGWSHGVKKERRWRPGGWSHGDAAFKKQRRWYDHVLALAEVMLTELKRVNPKPDLVDIGYSKDGPIVRALVDAIPVITGEHPRRPGVAKRLERLK